MRDWREHRSWLWWLGCGLAVSGLSGLWRTWAQRIHQEPKWVRFHLKDLATGVEVESQSQTWESALGGTSNAAEHLYVAPFIEVGGIGSIYHPNLLDFEFQTQNSLAYDQHTVENSAAGWSGSQSNFDYLLRGNANVRVLKQRPYATSFHASRGRSLRTLDFFSRTVIDSEGYGAQTGYQNEWIPFTVSYDHTQQVESGLARPSSWMDDILAVRARNDRQDRSDKTEFDYRYGNFERRNLGSEQDSGYYHHANLTDTEHFGADDWIRLRSPIRFYQTKSTFQDNTDFQWMEDLNLDHRDNLRSYYQASLGLREGGPTHNDNFTGTAGVDHQLYESLNSVAEVRGEYFSTRGFGSRSTISRFSPGIRETYTKKLSDSSNLTLGYSFSVSPENRESSGDVVTVLDEPHVLRDGEVTFLKQPSVFASSIHVTDASGVVVYDRGFDYEVRLAGVLTEISRIPGGRIPNGGTVLVDYLAAGQPAGSFTSFLHAFRWRVSLFNRLLSLYTRLTADNKTGVGELVLNEFNDYVAGVESEWKWFRVAAEYEKYDSNLTPFEAWRFREGVQWRPIEAATFGLDLSQGLTEFNDSGRRVRFFDFLARTQLRPNPRLSFRVEGGIRSERGDGVDQTVGMAQAFVDYRIGKLTAELAYQFQDQGFFEDHFLNHYLHLEVRRRF